jgi:DNA-binding CsgD family transcriptional regulator
VAVSERTMHTNAAAARLLGPADHGLVWDWATRALAGDGPPGAELRLASGMPVTARVRAVRDGAVLSGALARFDAPAPASTSASASAHRHAQPARHRAAIGWDSLTDTERGVAGIIAEGMANREAAARLYLSPHTIGYHLRQIFRKLAITSRVELTRLVVGQHDTGPGR